jgi:hypothetical protein
MSGKSSLTTRSLRQGNGLRNNLVMGIDQNEQVEGNYTITLDFSGKPDGIYFIALIADHKDVCKIKAIKAN